jgi:hypothetical protein
MRPRFSKIKTAGQARMWRGRGEGLSRRLAGRFMIHECVCILALDTCLRRRNLTMIEERPFLRRWLSLCEPGVLVYLQSLEQSGDWRDLKAKIHAVAARSAYVLPEMRNLARERQAFIGAILPEVSAIGRYLSDNPNSEFLPDPDATPDADKGGSGGGDDNGGATGQGGGANAAPRPSPGESEGEFIEMDPDELAAILDAAEDNDAGPHMRAML